MRPVIIVVLLCFFLAVTQVCATDFIQLDACPTPSADMYCYWEQPVLGPAAQWVAYTDASTYAPYFEYWPSVVIRSRDGSHRFAVTVDTQGRHRSPAWSYDGRWLALFVDSVGSEKSSLWVVDFVTLLVNATPVAERLIESDNLLQASWSVDANQLAYEQQGQGIWVIARTGGAATQVVPNGHSPSWGPGGQLVFERNGDLWLRNATGDMVRRTETAFDELNPAWSPNGDWIAYTSDAAGTWDVWVIGAFGGSPVRVTYDKHLAVAPSWSGDGKTLTFMTLDGRDTIWLATQLPDWTTSVEQRGWGQVKALFR